MASIASIISFDPSAAKASRVSAAKLDVSASSDRTVVSASAPYSRASSIASFGLTDEHCSPTATPDLADEQSLDSIIAEASVMSSSLAAALPSADDSAESAAAAAAADANRRRKVLTSRPPNSFILYRSDKLRELVQKHPELKQTQISKMCADNWKNETEEVKEHYRRKQQEAKTLFLNEQAIEVERISGGASDKGVIKRIQPTNTFIRYRTEMKKKLAAQFATMNQKDVSRACGLMWRSEPEHVKLRYRQSYNKEKRDFERLCTTSTLEPSQEALSALASVMAASAVKVAPPKAQASSTPNSTAALSPATNLDKKRRLSEGCQSAPNSPPELDASSHDPMSRVRAKRPRSFHTPSRSESLSSGHSSPVSFGASLASIKEVSTPTTSSRATNVGSISLPSCASLLSLADSASSLGSRMPHATRQPSSSPRGSISEPHYAYTHKHQSMLPVPHGAFDSHMQLPPTSSHYAHQYNKQPMYLDSNPRRICAISSPSYFHSQISDSRHSSQPSVYLPLKQMPPPPSSSTHVVTRR
ncbi:hypothetical protein GGI25_004282 [Coemansia spiralis]|uniref:HMG box domain-containing protein n=1 Tax=Coemansia spiralis TaxID=417178 RepID=A0A9W8G5V0_9FUNG|nr:hypothetical protein GGI25_004282 [Coemansia spiralis]